MDFGATQLPQTRPLGIKKSIFAPLNDTVHFYIVQIYTAGKQFEEFKKW
jgi:hypothetical protein